MRIVVAVPTEPLPRTPQGRSAGIKLDDWLTISHSLQDIEIRVESARELSGAPHIVESFLTDATLLSETTVPRSSDHLFFEDIRAYWPRVIEADIPVIPVLPSGQYPTAFPVFVRGRISSLRSTATIKSKRELPHLTRDVIVRPFVEIERCGSNQNVTKELRVHIAFGVVCCVEFLFPDWASQHPTRDETQAGIRWAHSALDSVLRYGERLAETLKNNGSVLILRRPATGCVW
jgi:hypothetical protein